MADFTMDVELNPKVNQKLFDSELNRLEKSLRSMRSGTHSATAALGARLIRGMVSSEMASTTTQARMILEGRMGGGLSSIAKSNLRTAQSVAQIQLNKEKQASFAQARQERQETLDAERQRRAAEKASAQQQRQEAFQKLTEKQKIEDLQKRSYMLGYKFSTFNETTSETAKANLLTNVVGLKYDLDKILQEYRSTNKKIPAEIKKIEKDTKKLSKGIGEFQVSPQKSATATAIGSFFGRVSSALSALIQGFTLQKFVGMATSGLAKGEGDIANQMIYGQNLDIGPARALANFYDISEESLLKVQQAAITWYTRMINNRLSEEEWQAAGRTPFGQMLVSGEAARNPMGFYIDIMNYIRKNRHNAPEVMLNLQRLGWDPNLMKMGAFDYSIEDFIEDTEWYRYQITKEKAAATGSRPVRAWTKKLKGGLEAAASNLVFGQLSAEQVRNLQSLNPAEREIFLDNMSTTNRYELQGRSFPVEILKGALEPVTTAMSVIINNQNTMNITGNDSKETAEEVRDQMENWTVMGLNDYIKGMNKTK